MRHYTYAIFHRSYIEEPVTFSCLNVATALAVKWADVADCWS